ncbi:tumor protein p63-regulated gene 1-like protein [Dreissena polymorpha]|uniref:HSac2 domain-containing protein n=1 Tax=Dreissena polymorpha TaxID=45954 RepID=A0A9D4H3U8_DREPO|nr:tumor protein p63-regulated gene 1-like protein [Dreissena polymorpha]XP_052283821.1 tumor protein p63-regulated gene 1-like protein [Dreissena polymorpha]KAH3827025.1 hypothetical protein DPMN_128953 [Dreissena polymorpha]
MAESGDATSTNAKPAITEVHLEDETTQKVDMFEGATLDISGEDGEHPPDVDFAGPGLNRNRPGSTIGRQSVRSTTSRTTMKPGGYKSEISSKSFFCYKENNLTKAMDRCQNDFYKEELDGQILGKWLLAEIDHWDHEREKILILAENSVLIFRYNFITDTVIEKKRVMLHVIDSILLGDFTYPDWSIMPMVSSDHAHGGIQIKWNSGEPPTFGQRWNPWCATIPWVCLAHHPLLYNPRENETVTFNVDEFYESLLDAVSKAYGRKRPGERVTVVEGPILIQSYASISSIIFNQSNIGYFKDRNGVCF